MHKQGKNVYSIKQDLFLVRIETMSETGVYPMHEC